MATEPKRSINIYLCYAQKDESLKQEFEDYLIIMQDSGLISDWAERQVQRGTDWSQVVDPRLLIADLVLLLVSPGLVASGYGAGAEVSEALKRSEAGETLIIPIILRYVDWKRTFLGSFQALPMDARPVSSWPNRYDAWKSVDQGIRTVIQHLLRNGG